MILREKAVFANFGNMRPAGMVGSSGSWFRQQRHTLLESIDCLDLGQFCPSPTRFTLP